MVWTTHHSVMMRWHSWQRITAGLNRGLCSENSEARHCCLTELAVVLDLPELPSESLRCWLCSCPTVRWPLLQSAALSGMILRCITAFVTQVSCVCQLPAVGSDGEQVFRFSLPRPIRRRLGQTSSLSKRRALCLPETSSHGVHGGSWSGIRLLQPSAVSL